VETLFAKRIMSSRTIPYEELPQYLTPAELQAYLSLSRNTVYDLLRRNEIPHRRFGRTIRIPKTALKQPDSLASR
jgi:excisionase family DNA binding protein